MGGLVRGKKGKPASKPSQRVRGRVSDRPRRKSSNDGKLARALADAAEVRAHQAATAEILKVIANSPSDVQPVFDAIAQSAIRLIGGHSCSVTRVLHDRLHLASLTSTDSSADDLVRSNYPMLLTEQTPIAEAARSGRTLLVSDTEKDPRFAGIGRQVARSRGFRTIAYVPMLRQQAVLGVIHVAGAEPHSITDKHVSLLESFASQAVIAIQNARLFNETKEALERQTATAEILRVISRSPTDIQPVLDAVAESAARLCEAADCSIFRLDDDRLVLAAHHGPITAPGPIGEFSISLRRESVAGRTVLDARTVHVADIRAAADEYPSTFEATRSMGFRTMLNVPLIREGVAIGVIQLPRTEVRPFTDRQIALLETFADQAVIAIENVRLFNELEARNREASEALERQTATAEILKIISESPTDTRPVFYGICRSAARLFSGNVGIALVKGDQIDMAAMARPDGPAEWSDFDGIAVGATHVRTESELAAIHKAIRAYYPQQFDPKWIAHGAGHRSARDARLSRHRSIRGARAGQGHFTRDRLSGVHDCPAAPRGQRNRRHLALVCRTRQGARRQAARPGADLRRPGGDRDRERATVQRDQGGARAADGDRRDPQSHQRVADRHAAGVRCDRSTARSCTATWKRIAWPAATASSSPRPLAPPGSDESLNALRAASRDRSQLKLGSTSRRCMERHPLSGYPGEGRSGRARNHEIATIRPR